MLSAIVGAGTTADQGAEPPARARAAVAEPTAAEFRVEVERFADVRILRYRVPGFEALDARTKKLLYYLYEAALCGRLSISFDIAFMMSASRSASDVDSAFVAGILAAATFTAVPAAVAAANGLRPVSIS